MKNIITAALFISLLLPINSQANELIFGVKGGLYQPKYFTNDPTLMVSAQLSYEFLDLTVVDIAIELEAGKTVIDGDINKTKINGLNPTSESEYSANTIGTYLSARTIGPIYAIGRIGVLYTSFKSLNINQNDTKLALGAGIGFSLGIRTELELTRHELNENNSYYLSLGAAF